MSIKTYSELSKIESFFDRFEYLKLAGQVGIDTFGRDRYLNQSFYHSNEWRSIRDYVIARDNGCDLGLSGFEIHGKIYIHHMNPIVLEDLVEADLQIIDPEYLICATHQTHNAIHYGNPDLLPNLPIERKPNDMCPWLQ